MQDFHRTVKGRLAYELDGWLKAAAESGINAMRNFSPGIEKDKAAVLGALTIFGGVQALLLYEPTILL